MPSPSVSWHRIAGQANLAQNAIQYLWSHCLLLAFKTSRIRGIIIPHNYCIQKGRIACLNIRLRGQDLFKTLPLKSGFELM